MRNRIPALLVTLAFLGCSGTSDESAQVAEASEAVAQALASSDRSSEDRERDARSRPELVVPLLELEPGMRVVDILAGGGYYSEILARVVGSEGHVYLNNNAGYAALAGEPVTARLAGGRLPNVERWDRELESLDFAPESLDAALLVMSFHDVYWVTEQDGFVWKIDGEAFLSGLKAALKPGGRVVIVDHSAVAGSGKEAIGTLHRIDEAFARERMKEAGFALQSEHDFLRNPEDDRLTGVFDEAIKGRTDRFVLVYAKP